MSRTLVALASLLVLAASPAALAQHDDHHGPHERRDGAAPMLGTVVFPNSGLAAAQEPFLRGVALVHSFEYEDAADAFREAQRRDPSFALAYWLEAFTYDHLVWGMQDLVASRSALRRLAPTAEARLAKAKTSRERALGGAFEALYASDSTLVRVRAFADSLRRIADAAPDDQEANAFAAVAVMTWGYFQREPERRAVLDQAGAYAQRVLDLNRNHPGAAHYIIHVFDSPSTAAKALDAARAYDKIAPDAEHALHMPSHIFLQLGLWDDVTASNERAWRASRAWVERGNRSTANLSWHTLSWLQYSYLQQGRWAAARAIVDSARALLANAAPGDYVDAHFAVQHLEFQHAAETGRWPDRPLTTPTSTAEGSARATSFRMRSTYWRMIDEVMRTGSGSGDAFRVAIDALRPGASTAPAFASAALQIDALAARHRGDDAGHLELLEQSAAIERRLGAFIGPPERLFSLEMLGDALIARGRAAEAAAAFEDVLRLCPNRSRALLGLARARQAAGDRAAATETYAKLAASWHHADADVRQLAGRGRGGGQ